MRLQLIFPGQKNMRWTALIRDSGELLLGDIVISLDKVKEQAEKYGHGVRREYAFLIAHSMLHLLGYDHMTEEEAADMESRQSRVLEHLNITR